MAVASSSFSSSSSCSSSSAVRPTSKGPQVFINFWGPNVSNRFVAFLLPILKDANINVFVDKDEVVGTNMDNLLLRIEESRVAVVIFSKAYTRSEWCLDELAMIRDCKDRGSLSVFPIFYKLAPSAVQELRGKFGDTFRALKRSFVHEPERTCKWEEALKSISKINGMSLAKKSDNNERQFIDSMVFEIQRLLSHIAVRRNPIIPSNLLGGFLVPARRLDITHSDNPEKWMWSSIYDRTYKADIEIVTMINTHTRKLTPGTKYEVVFLVSLNDKALGWKKQVALNMKVMHNGIEKEHDKALYLDEYTGEHWVDIHVGEFEATPTKEDAKIFFSMHQYVDTDLKSGLVVKGVAIRPLQ